MGFSKELLSASIVDNGRPIIINATASPGDLIHTAVNSAGVLDEIWLWGVNNDSSDVVVTIEFGGAAARDQMPLTVPAVAGLYQLVPGIPLIGGVEVRAFAQTTGVINIFGYVNRIVC
jgi:hypothetical protein